MLYDIMCMLYDFKCYILVKDPTHESIHRLAGRYVFLFVLLHWIVVNLLYVVQIDSSLGHQLVD